MQVILLEKIARLGELGDLVTVRAGYGRNFLLPQGKAVPATPENIQLYEQKRAELQALEEARLNEARARAATIEQTRVLVAVKSGEEGRLFGSVGTRDLVEAAERLGLTLNKSEIRMPDGPIRELGEYEVTVHLHAEVDASLRLEVVAE